MSAGNQYPTLISNLTRKVHPISRGDDFFDTLQYQLHLAVGDILFDKVEFTIILNAINRSNQVTRSFQRDKLEEIPLVYTGLKIQRALLKKSFGDVKEVESAWEELERTKQETQNYMDLMKVNREYFGQIAKGKLDLDAINIGRLKDYFADDINPLQKAEKAILEQQYIDPQTGKSQCCFDTQKDLYLSVPLIGFAEFDGVAHIIFQAHGANIVSKHLIGLVIKRFSNEYEGLIIDWAAIGENKEKRKSIQFLFDEEIKDEGYYRITNQNPILSELRYLDRYLKYEGYYEFRLQEADTIPDILYLQYLRQAITAILIDSYAHNISAHSLTALSWWFGLRAQLRDKIKTEEATELEKIWGFVDQRLNHGSRLSEYAITELKERLGEIRHYRQNLNAKYAEAGKDGNSLITYPGHLSRELQPLFKFLMEKGAYWSGITRDVNVGGKINSFFSVLWYDFVNNPLYLGTIAQTEDIRRIQVNVTLYKPEEAHDPSALFTTREIEFEGLLAEVNLDEIYLDPTQKEDDLGLSQRSVFVKPGEAYGILKEKLDKVKIYFPGGVVGKHSFFTMIENEIRNVKHYNGEDLLKLQEEGLILNISLQPCSLSESSRQELYRVGIWLKTSTLLQKNNDLHLVHKKWNALYSEITEPVTHSPKLGGTHQDKICAAMLLNSRFSSVQNGFTSPNRDDRSDTRRDRDFFPWITPACSLLTENKTNATQHRDFILTALNIKSFDELGKVVPEEFSGLGYVKKYLHIWRFEDTLDLDDGTISPFENCARFRFVYAPAEKTLDLRKNNGVVRIITKQLESQRPQDVYQHWLQIWNQNHPPVLLLKDDGKANTLLALDNNQFKFYTADDFIQNSDAKTLKSLAEANATECVLDIAHKANVVVQPDILRYRNHGSMRTHFWDNLDLKASINPFRYIAEKHPDRLPELFETLSTRICIFDNRLWQRVRKDVEDSQDTNGNTQKRLDFYRHKLKLVVHGESPTDKSEDKNWLQEWEGELKDFIPTCHFLVLHLSFIERILEAKYLQDPAYKAGNIGLFIEKELLPAIKRQGAMPDNFFLVVTTGRGRTEWLSALEQEKYSNFSKFTIFRPVESLISAVEHSLAMKDDIDLKFRLVKVLFGS